MFVENSKKKSFLILYIGRNGGKIVLVNYKIQFEGIPFQ